MLKRTLVHPALRVMICLLVFLFLTAGMITPVHAAGTGWYCTRAKNHAQPIADPPLREVESLGGYYIDHVHFHSEVEIDEFCKELAIERYRMLSVD